MRALLVFAFIALQFHAAPAFSSDGNGTNVKVVDKRVSLDEGQFRWLGKVMTPSGSWCSGTLITASLVLTAGHCFSKIDGQSVSYLPTAFQKIGSQKVVTGRTIDGKRILSKSVMLEDWALIVLDKPIKFNKYPKLAAFNPLKHKLVSIMGYPREVPGPYLLKDCPVGEALGLGGNSFSHYCKVSPGQSGGPLVIDLNSAQPTIVAMNSYGNKGFLMFGTNDDVAFGLSPSEVETIHKYAKQYR